MAKKSGFRYLTDAASIIIGNCLLAFAVTVFISSSGIIAGGTTGIGIIDRSGGSSGGTDVIALIIQKYTHRNLGILLYAIDGPVLLLQAMFSNIDQVLYGLLLLMIQVLMMNHTMLSGKVQIQLLIISDHAEAIRRNLLQVQKVGVTVIPIQKGYTHMPGEGLLCITSRKKLHSITEMIQQQDPLAFFTIHEVNEVRGNGFSYTRYPASETKKQ